MFDEPPSRFREVQRAIPYPSVSSRVHYSPENPLMDVAMPDAGSPPLQVRIEQVAPRQVVFLRHVGPYGEVGRAWGQLMSWAGLRGLIGPAPTLIGIVHDDPEITVGEKVRYDACLAVDDQVRPEGDIGVQQLEGGEYAVVCHRGPYDQLGSTYARLCGEWLPSSGRELSLAPCFEIYRNSPMDTAPENLLTDIFMPLEP
jgi:AraC family transcriptional regulator